MSTDVEQLAELLRERNTLDDRIATMTGRPMASGHLGEWLAHRIFGIRLETNAARPGIDGRFTTGPLAGDTVNVKWYLKREGLLDVARSEPDHYLVMTGPVAQSASSAGSRRPWVIAYVYLFQTPRLMAELRDREVALGVATSIRASQWAAAEVYPEPRNPALPLDAEQFRLLRLFAPP
jgi:hypothetical protein